MLKIISTLLFLTYFFQFTLANQGDLEVKLLNSKRKEVTSGSTSNVLVTFINNADTTKEFQIKLYTPGNDWRQIADYSSIKIEKKSSLNKIIGIRIPKSSKTGDYNIKLEAFEMPDVKSFGKVEIPVFVLPRYEISVEKMNAPRYLFSGDTLGIKFMINNFSNLDVNITSTTFNGGIPEISYLNIPQDSSIITNVPLSIPKELSQYIKQTVMLSAFITNNPETVSTSSYTFDVIPSNKIKFDGYNRFPVKVTGLFASSNRWGNNDYSSMFDIRGSGNLNETKRQKLEFHLRGPNRTGNPILGLNDEYYLMYTSPKIEATLGDRNYSLSELTESSRNGRGVKLQYNTEKLSVGSFYDIPRYFPEIKYIYSIYSNYKLNPKMQFSAGFLSKTDTSKTQSKLLTVSGFIKPFSWGNTSFELAGGQKQSKLTKAFKVTVNINKSIFTSNLSYTHADPGFPGYFSDAMYISSRISANLKKISLSLNYDMNNTNLALDTIYSNAPKSKNLNFLSTFNINQKHSIILGAYSMGFEDKAPLQLFNYNKYYGRMSVNSKLNRIELSIQGEVGKIDNFLETLSGDLTDFYNGYFSMKYSYKNALSVSGFINYQGGQQYKITGFNRYYYGGSLRTNLNKKSFVTLDYQSDYELQEYFRDRSLVSLSTHYQLLTNHELDLTANYNLIRNTLDQKEYSVQFRYTYTINVPLSKKKDVGSIIGQIINKGVEKVQGVIINLNGNVTMTDKNGYFKFPMVKVGTYLLAIDESSFGINSIAETPGPYWVTISPGKETSFVLSLTKSGNIYGGLEIQVDDKSGQKGYIAVKEEIDKVIVEASSGTEIFRVFTGRDGKFLFSDLRPGKWHIKVYPNGIPKGYQIVTDQFDVNLVSGKEEKVEVIIRKISRQIKFQNKY